MKYIFLAGAPGSKWSSVAKNIYYSADIDRSDYRDERFRENMMFITPREHTVEGFQSSMRKMRQVWQPIAQKIKPEWSTFL